MKAKIINTHDITANDLGGNTPTERTNLYDKLQELECNGQLVTVDCVACEVADDADFVMNYHNVTLPDGTVVEALSGHHLLIVNQDAQPTMNEMGTKTYEDITQVLESIQDCCERISGLLPFRTTDKKMLKKLQAMQMQLSAYAEQLDC